ncbi:hypothetical protein D3C75_705920 [compost metagenome]
MDYQEGLKRVGEANAQIVEANDTIKEVIAQVYIYQWNWYLSVALIIVPWIIWAIFRKKESTGRLLIAGLFIMIFSAVLDTMGIENGLWAYPVKAIPSPTLSFSYRLSVLPVLAMLLIQVKPHINPVLKAVFYSGISAFVGLPLMSAADLYKKLHWAYTYSFCILFVVYLVAHWLVHLKSFKPVSAEQGSGGTEFHIGRIREKAR